MPNNFTNIYVRSIADGDNNGEDWYNAYQSISQAINYIDSAPESGYYRIHVAEDGTYNLNDGFTIDHEKVSILGGYILNTKNIVSGYIDESISIYKTRITIESGINVFSGVFESKNIDYTYNDDTTFFIGNQTEGNTQIYDCDIRTFYGINNSGLLVIQDTNAVGKHSSPVNYHNEAYGYNELRYSGGYTGSPIISGNIFIQSPIISDGMFLDNLTVSQFANGIEINTDIDTDIKNTTIFKCSNGIILTNNITSGNIGITDSLIHNCYTGAYLYDLSESGSINLTIDNSTIQATNSIFSAAVVSGDIFFNNSIISGSLDNIYSDIPMYGLYSLFTDNNANLNTSGCVIGDPNFLDVDNGLLNLAIGTSENTKTSDALNVGQLKLSENTEVIADLNGFVYNNINNKGKDSFLYKAKNNIVNSDYMYEVSFSNFNDVNGPLNFEYNYIQKVSLYNVETISAFSLNEDTPNPYPFDWDYVNFKTPKIEEINYIVPRSVVYIGDAFAPPQYGEGYLNVIPSVKTTKTYSNVTGIGYKSEQNRGVSFDYGNSQQGQNIIAMIDNDQILKFRNMFTGEFIGKYPLMCPVPSGERTFIKPSGLIPYAKTDTGYKFIREDDPSTVIEGINEDGDFEWFPTQKNKIFTNGGMYGILAYKDYIYITASVYTTNQEKESRVYVYPNKGYYKDYHTNDPASFLLDSKVRQPRDITVTEDGTFLILDANTIEKIDPSDNEEIELYGTGVIAYMYKPRFDYAIKQSNNTLNTKVIIKESYNNVTTIKPELE